MTVHCTRTLDVAWTRGVWSACACHWADAPNAGSFVVRTKIPRKVRETDGGKCDVFVWRREAPFVFSCGERDGSGECGLSRTRREHAGTARAASLLRKQTNEQTPFRSFTLATAALHASSASDVDETSFFSSPALISVISHPRRAAVHVVETCYGRGAQVADVPRWSCPAPS